VRGKEPRTLQDFLCVLGQEKTHTINFFVGCGAIFTVPFYDINPINNMNLKAKSKMDCRVRSGFERTICDIHSTNKMNLQEKSLIVLGAWKRTTHPTGFPL
jgi:hypothetical protein